MWNTDILIYIYVYKLYRIKLILITIQLNLFIIFIPPPHFFWHIVLQLVGQWVDLVSIVHSVCLLTP